MGLLKKRKNKRFSYTPRYYKGDSSPFEMKHKFDEYRSTVGGNNSLKGKFNAALNDYKHNTNKQANKTVLIIALFLVFVFLYIIDFDLSIFFPG
ncbi:riboflavin synthase subunit beta [Lacinutrix salivirga]